MKKILNEGNQIHNFILCVCENFCDTILLRCRNRTNYGSGSDFLTSSGSGSTRQKVTFLRLHRDDRPNLMLISTRKCAKRFAKICQAKPLFFLNLFREIPYSHAFLNKISSNFLYKNAASFRDTHEVLSNFTMTVAFIMLNNTRCLGNCSQEGFQCTNFTKRFTG
jgi:hypothetical protein